MGTVPQLAAMNVCHRFYSLDSFLRSAAQNGFELVELWTGPMHLLCDHAGHGDPAPVRERLSELGLSCIAVCPEQNNPKPGNVAARGQAAERAFAHFCHAMELAEGLGASLVTVTSGWGFYDEPRADAWARSAAMLRRLAERAEDKGLTLVMEALQPEESNLVHTASELAELIGEVDRPALAACVDFGAMERAGDTPDSYFDALGPLVRHAHFVDTGATSHVAWGDGHRDMAADLARLMARGYEGVCSVETYNDRYFSRPAEADAQVMGVYRAAVRTLQERQAS